VGQVANLPLSWLFMADWQSAPRYMAGWQSAPRFPIRKKSGDSWIFLSKGYTTEVGEDVSARLFKALWLPSISGENHAR
jgi:hypothetical protein